MFNLALAYRNGTGTAADDQAYFEWTRRAARAGHARAMFNLALAYEEGIGTHPDAARYFEWTRKAAQTGHPSAMFNLALAYAEYMDTKVNLVDTPGYLDFAGEDEVDGYARFAFAKNGFAGRQLHLGAVGIADHQAVFDLLAGTATVREQLDAGVPVTDIIAPLLSCFLSMP